MFHTVFSVFLSWQVLLLTAVLALILCLIFVKVIKKKQTEKTHSKKKKESPGTIIVPSSTYEMLKKEKRIHNIDKD